MTDRVLSLSLRPKTIGDCVGQENLITLLENQFESGRIPHFYIIHGPIGSGKTTMARILALALQMDPAQGEKRLHLSEETWATYRRYEIREINAANTNGIDDVRTIIEGMRYKPIAPSRARIVIMDEAHQITAPAQNTLLTETEDVANHVYYIFCTSNLAKIIPALQRRAYIINTSPLAQADVTALVERAKDAIDAEEPTEPLVAALAANGVTSPGLILQAAEKYFNGMPAEEAVLNTDLTGIDTMAICRSITSGSWAHTARLLKPISKTDIMPIKYSVCGYLKSVLLNSTGKRAVAIAHAIMSIMDDKSNDNIPLFLSTICLACVEMSAAG
jgi:DNA polymerase III delta prime subunit